MPENPLWSKDSPDELFYASAFLFAWASLHNGPASFFYPTIPGTGESSTQAGCHYFIVLGRFAATMFSKGPVSAHLHEYRHAVALNNMAVLLQEKGCFRQALETFRDATSLMKSAVASLGPKAEKESVALSGPPPDAKTLTASASQRIAFPVADRPERHPIKPEVLADDDNPFSSVDLIFECSPTSSRVLFIRMEEYGKDRDQEDRDCDTDLAIILHNYGLSCYSLARIVENPHLSQMLHQNALSVMTLAQNVLAIRSRKGNMQRYQLPKAFMIVIVITNNMSQILYATGGMSPVMTSCYSRIFGLIADLQTYDVRGAFAKPHGACAA